MTKSGSTDKHERRCKVGQWQRCSVCPPCVLCPGAHSYGKPSLMLPLGHTSLMLSFPTFPIEERWRLLGLGPAGVWMAAWSHAPSGTMRVSVQPSRDPDHAILPYIPPTVLGVKPNPGPGAHPCSWGSSCTGQRSVAGMSPALPQLMALARAVPFPACPSHVSL